MEVFSSIQGEGAYVGEPQAFVRFARCPLRCLYCDTPGSWVVRKAYRLILAGGESEAHPNPATVSRIQAHVRRLERGTGKLLTVSLTGGEPLLYPDFVAALAARLRREGRRVHLETAGVHPRGLERALRHLDHVSMDWKISSTLEKGDFGALQERFLRAAREVRRRDLVVKVVVTPDVSEGEFREATRRIASVDAKIPVIVQPATPKRRIRRRVSAAKLRAFLRIAGKDLRELRVLPQLHPLLGLK